MASQLDILKDFNILTFFPHPAPSLINSHLGSTHAEGLDGGEELSVRALFSSLQPTTMLHRCLRLALMIAWP